MALHNNSDPVQASDFDTGCCGGGFNDSAALHDRSPIYPSRFNGRVPKRVRMVDQVESEVFQYTRDPADYLVCKVNAEYDVTVNRNGAVSAILPGGKKLGLKPHEFEVVEWHGERQ